MNVLLALMTATLMPAAPILMKATHAPVTMVLMVTVLAAPWSILAKA